MQDTVIRVLAVFAAGTLGATAFVFFTALGFMTLTAFGLVGAPF